MSIRSETPSPTPPPLPPRNPQPPPLPPRVLQKKPNSVKEAVSPPVNPAVSVGSSTNAPLVRNGSAKSERSEDAISISSATDKVTYHPQKAAKTADSKPAVSEQKKEEENIYDDILSPPVKPVSPVCPTGSPRAHSTPTQPAEDRDVGTVEIPSLPAPPTKTNAEAEPDSRPSTASSDSFATPSPTFPGDTAASLMLKKPSVVGGAPLALSFDSIRLDSSKAPTDPSPPTNGHTMELETSSKQSTLKHEEKSEATVRESTAIASISVASGIAAQGLRQSPDKISGWTFKKGFIYDSEDSDDDFVESSVLEQMIEATRRARAESRAAAEKKRMELEEEAQRQSSSLVVPEVHDQKVEDRTSEEASLGGSSHLSNGDAADRYEDALMEQPVGDFPSRTDDVIQPMGDSPSRTDDVIPPASVACAPAGAQQTTASQNGGELMDEDGGKVTEGESQPTDVLLMNGDLSMIEEEVDDSHHRDEAEEGLVEEEREGLSEYSLVDDSLVGNDRFSQLDVSQSLLDGLLTPVELTLTESAVRGAQALIGSRQARLRENEGGENESDEYSSLPEEEDEEGSWVKTGANSPTSMGSEERLPRGLTLKRNNSWMSRTLDRSAQVGGIV